MLNIIKALYSLHHFSSVKKLISLILDTEYFYLNNSVKANTNTGYMKAILKFVPLQQVQKVPGYNSFCIMEKFLLR